MSRLSRSEVRLATSACIVLSCLVSLTSALIFHRSDAHASVYGLANLVGGTAYGVLHGLGLTITTDAQGTAAPVLYHAARMPVATLVVAAGALLFGEHGLRSIAVFKTLLFLVPVWLTMALVLRWRGSTAQRITRCVLLLLPFAALPFVADVVNLQVEEGYSYSALAYAFALLLFSPTGNAIPVLTRFVLPFAVAVDLLYLSKSSMWPAVLILLLFAMWRVHATRLNLVLLLLVLAAPVSWAAHQKAVGGRATIGTSLDGLNLHKGQNPQFLERYPPPPGGSLDQYDPELSGSHVFASEWAFHDFHQHAALDFMRRNPEEAARGGVRKAEIFFFSMRKTGSSEPSSRAMAMLETLGIVIMRCALWTAMLWAAFRLFHPHGSRFPALLFLLLVAACAAPYLVGFAYTRHVSILLYPSVLLLCRFASPAMEPQRT